MISRDAFAQEVRELTDTAFAVTYLILGNSADSEDAMSAAILRAFENRGKLRKRESFRAWFLQILRRAPLDAGEVTRHGALAAGSGELLAVLVDVIAGLDA